uniref:NADH-ubiquinone oxidoreductase chain 6 n=1 Tax=Pseudaphritis urvillii TaxID=56722 RepID=D6N174_PSEUR|nr:NADH dehydrogenase subunit 6 [Pseudaphritis urvillii]ACZ62666.1 NADH dehydrogenase subunit 6 [Pseudaphritis urvillii]WJQ22711.1 NADH dehydrogenase subunit 6 [Pseudaphritis urvillii]
MGYLMSLFMLGLVLGMVAVAANPSPYFAAFGLVMVAGMGCGVVMGYGGAFLSLVLFLIYLGGMLVVFAYSAALVAEPYPEGLGSAPVLVYVVGFLGMIGGVGIVCWEGWDEAVWFSTECTNEFSMCCEEAQGMSEAYGFGGFLLIMSAWVLLLALFVVLEMTRGASRGPLRSVK